MIVNFLSLRDDTPKKDFWDYGLLYDLLAGFDSQEVDHLEGDEFALVVLPARSHADLIDRVNEELSKVRGVLLFLMGDEESVFPIEKIKHKNIRIWVQNPNPKLSAEHRKLGTGYPFPLREFKPEVPNKNLKFFFGGQVTHIRREECVSQLRDLTGGRLIESKSFTAGIDQKEYFSFLSQAKIAPCPSGPETPDTFRLFEALELGCIPIADSQTPKKNWRGFWEWLFDEPVPFPVIEDWTSLPGYIEDCIAGYPQMNNKIQAWWLRKKLAYRKQIEKDIHFLGGNFPHRPITVVIPVSPIKSHPDISILEETILSVRHHLPNVEIILTFDGVRKEQENRRADYNEFIRRVLWKCREWGNVSPYIFDEHVHQVGMMRAVIDKIDTPLLLYCEQDTPLVTDEPIEWERICDQIMSGYSNLVRFHFEGVIPEEHRQFMIGKPENHLLATAQWSQRPHLASVPFYRRVIDEEFSVNAKCFIEDLVHGKVMEDFIRDGKLGWLQWKLHIYFPDQKNIKRSYHTDGRAGEKKYDKDQIW